MGQYLGGRFGYGVVLGDEDATLDVIEEERWKDDLAHASGVTSPYDENHYVQLINQSSELPYTEAEVLRKAWSAEHDAETSAWWAARRAIEDAQTVEFDNGGLLGYDYTVCALVVKDSGFRAHDAVTEIESAVFTVDPDWDRQLRDFAKLVGLEYPEDREPGWMMLLSYG